MNERTVHIDEFFRRQMEGHTEMPPPAVWDALEKRLDEKPGRKRPFPIWWFWTIAGLILVSSAVIIAGYLKSPELPPTRHATNTTLKNNTTITAKTNHQSNNNYNNTITKRTTNETSNTVATSNADHVRNSAPQQHLRGNQHKQTTNANLQPRNKQTVTHATPGNTETTTAAAGNYLPAAQRLRDKLMFLPAIPFGFELPVHIPMLQAPTGVPLPATQENDAYSSLAALPVSAIEQQEIQAPMPEIASGMVVGNKSLPGINNEDSDGAPSEISIAAPPPQDTSKKKTATDTSKSILEQTVYAVDNSRKKPLPFAAGIKLGFTRGFDPVWNADKWVIAPYVEYGLSSNFSVMFQPAFLIGKAKVGTLPNSDQVFYEILNTTFDSIAYVSRGKIDSSVITPNPPDTVFRTYRYGQVYDSIHVGYKVTNTQQWDVELPVMVKYKLNKTFAFIAGASATYSSVLRTKEEVTRYQGLMHQYEDVHTPQTFYVTTQGQEPPPGPPRKDVNTIFPYNTSPFSNYQPRQITETNNFWRYGFMLGASATIKERLMVELMLHKSGVDVNSVPDKQLQKIYTQPYLRLMVGYKLTK